jgi:uncharacterized protein involved in exopolysaccharide biosynthesis
MNDATDSLQNDLSLMAIVRFLTRNFLVIAIFVIIFASGAIALAFSLTPMYRSDVVVSPADSSGGLSGGGFGQLGGLASLAGINIGGGGSKKSDEALEFLRSHAFTAAFIERHSLMPVLFAPRWDPNRQQWRDAKKAPTISDGVKMFSKKIRQIVEDKRTGIVTVSIIWSDRVAAAQWANWLIAEADQALREKAIAEQDRSVEYLRSEAAHTSTVEVQNAISKVMETELKNAMVARTRDAYAFRVLDPAVASDAKDRESPNKALIAVVGAGMGFIVGVIVAAVRRRPADRR